jgi:hypothetical protein
MNNVQWLPKAIIKREVNANLKGIATKNFVRLTGKCPVKRQ